MPEEVSIRVGADTEAYQRGMRDALRAFEDFLHAQRRGERSFRDEERSAERAGREIDRLSRSARSASESVLSLSGSATKLAAQFAIVDRAVGAVIGGFQRLTRGIADTLRSGVELNLQFQTMETRLTGIFGSAQRAQQVLGTFQQVASTTAFTITDVSEAGVTLASFLGTAKDKTEELIKPLADLAAFMGTTMQEAAFAFGRAMAGGAGAADILRERGVLELVKSFKGIEDLTKLTLPEFRQALIETMVDTAGPIAGATDRMSRTTVGALSNMQDAWETFKRRLTEEVMPGIGRIARALTRALTDATQQMTGADSLGEAVNRIAAQIEQRIPEITSAISNLASAFGSLAETVARLPVGHLGRFLDVASRAVRILFTEGPFAYGGYGPLMGALAEYRSAELRRARGSKLVDLPEPPRVFGGRFAPQRYSPGRGSILLPLPSLERPRLRTVRRPTSATPIWEYPAPEEPGTDAVYFTPEEMRERRREAARAYLEAQARRPRLPSIRLSDLLPPEEAPSGYVAGTILSEGFLRGVRGVMEARAAAQREPLPSIRLSDLLPPEEAPSGYVPGTALPESFLRGTRGAMQTRLQRQQEAEATRKAEEAQRRYNQQLETYNRLALLSQARSAMLGRVRSGEAAAVVELAYGLAALATWQEAGKLTPTRGISIAAQTALAVGGALGGRGGSALSGAGAMALSGASVGQMFGGATGALVGAGIGAIAGGVMGFFGYRDPKVESAVRSWSEEIGATISDGIARGLSSATIAEGISDMLREAARRLLATKLVEIYLRPLFEELARAVGQTEDDRGFLGALKQTFGAAKRARNVDEIIDDIETRVDQVIPRIEEVYQALGEDRRGGVERGRPSEAGAISRPALTVTTISGAFKDTLEALADRRDNLLREIRDILAGMARPFAAPDQNAGGIHVEGDLVVQVQQVADIDADEIDRQLGERLGLQMA